MTDTTTLILILAAVVVLALLAYLIFGRKQRVEIAPPQKDVAVARNDFSSLPRTPATAPEGHGVGSEVAAAVEDVIDQFIGVDSHHDVAAEPKGRKPADQLTTIKGLGPKAEARLNALGVFRFEQIATLDAESAAALDQEMGAFKGRMARDQWIAQAQHLAAGDRDGFEAKFGKIG